MTFIYYMQITKIKLLYHQFSKNKIHNQQPGLFILSPDSFVQQFRNILEPESALEY